jgi:hypothetical protein
MHPIDNVLRDLYRRVHKTRSEQGRRVLELGRIRPTSGTQLALRLHAS